MPASAPRWPTPHAAWPEGNPHMLPSTLTPATVHELPRALQEMLTREVNVTEALPLHRLNREDAPCVRRLRRRVPRVPRPADRARKRLRCRVPPSIGWRITVGDRAGTQQPWPFASTSCSSLRLPEHLRQKMVQMPLHTAGKDGDLEQDQQETVPYASAKEFHLCTPTGGRRQRRGRKRPSRRTF